MATAVIKPVDNALSDLIDKTKYRAILASVGAKYDTMQSYIDNLGQDISSIDKYVVELREKEALGFDIGTSVTTLTFQKMTLDIDYAFYTSMKKCYMRKLYDDLWKYTRVIVLAAMEIEPRTDEPDDVLDAKMQSMESTDESGEYSMSNIFDMLAVAEKNLFELSVDISLFDGLIESAKEKEGRGFEIGNLVMNLVSQKAALETDYKNSILKLDQFLVSNEKFADKCMTRVVSISQQVQDAQDAGAHDAQDAQGAGDQDTHA